jgi:zinc protease
MRDRRVLGAIAVAVMVMVAAAVPASAAPFARSGIADWTKPPAAQAEPGFTPPVVTRSRLANGIAVLVVENHALPIASVELVVPGAGAAADPMRRAGLAAFTADLLDEGAGGLSALALAEAQAQLGAQIALEIDADAARVSARTLSATLDATLALIAKLVTQPTFAPGELARLKRDRLTAIAQLRDRPPEVAALVLGQALFGADSGYGHPENGTRADVQAITLADVQAFYRAHWSPATMTLVIVGDVDPEAVKATLDAALGTWHPDGGKRATRPIATPPAQPRRLLLVDRPGAAQSDVELGLIGPDRNDPRYFAFEVLRTIVGGGFTGRVTQRLREQLGIIYHASTDMAWAVAPGPFAIGVAIATPETAIGLAEILAIVDDLSTRDAPAGELEKAKQNLVRALPEKFATNAATADAFADLAQLGLPDDTYAHFADGIRKVTAADVRACAQALLPPGKLVFAIVGDLAKIRGSLAKLGLGPPARYDLDARALP